jgi:hypothetical protein
MVYAPAAARAAWIDSETASADAIVQIGRTVAQVIAALIEDPAPRPQVLIVDFDAITPGELLDLHRIREGWFGTILGIGVVPASLRSSLGIERVLNTPLGTGALRDALDDLGFSAQTKRIPVIGDDETLPPRVFAARASAARVTVRRR